MAFILLTQAPQLALADQRERFTVLEENDSLPFYSDKHFTQGLRLDYLGPDIKPGSKWDEPFDWLSFGPFFGNGGGQHISRKYSLEFGQNIYTPKSHANPPPADDEPYAGWLYVGANLLQDTGGQHLDHVGIQLGAVGPVALGGPVQNDYHSLIGAAHFNGWNRQIQNEPGLVLIYDRHWRVPVIGNGADGVDIVPETGATIGNIYDYGEASAVVRIGHNLKVDYGPNFISPGISGTDYFDTQYANDTWGYYFFAGVGGRVVGKNIFLDGNNFRHSSSIGHKTLVGSVLVGLSVYQTAGWRLDLSASRQSQSFPGQHGQDVLGAIAVTYSW
ncbi:MAG TPA: lipid A deacylase LpxR family protein [Stellaceae bacterium]|nr:lipid A deacylase LpxR family protein [Stellaceae bacterium]